jgi:SAM-dependent methyltransferase
MTSTDAQQLPESLPFPPEALRVRVGASPSIGVFRQMGQSLAHTIVQLAGPLEDKRVLDFGCGCGRVLRYLARAHPSATYVGVDVDAEAISWCRRELHELADWELCSEWPPVPAATGSFDLIYAISVFTHLPENMQLAWLHELARALANDGLLIVSVYNELLHAILPPESQRQLQKVGVLYGNDGGTAGLPEAYQSCFHTPDYITTAWSHVLTVERRVERTFFHAQDAVLLRKPAQ